MSQSTEPTLTAPEERPVGRHRKAKAILAIAAGTALLLGGGGTYAYWSTSEALSATPVNSGDLDLTLGQGSWTIDGVIGDVTSVTNLADVRIVPGDVLTLTQPLTVDLVGDTLVADLEAELGAGFTGSVLGSRLDVVLTMPQDYGTSTGPTSYRLTEGDAGNVNATVTITFDPATPDQVATGVSVNLEDISFSLTQASS